MTEADCFAWDDLRPMWEHHEFGAVHDWLGERWSWLIQTRAGGHNDVDARFLQGLAFAALSLHFTRHHNQQGAVLLADDALRVLPAFLPNHRGLGVAPVLAAVNRLRPLLDGIDPEADCPMQPFVCDELQLAHHDA